MGRRDQRTSDVSSSSRFELLFRERVAPRLVQYVVSRISVARNGGLGWKPTGALMSREGGQSPGLVLRPMCFLLALLPVPQILSGV